MAAQDPARRRLISRALDIVERIGNRLPDPLTLFVILAGLVVLVSGLVARAGWTVIHPRTGESVGAVNLLSADGVRRMLTEAVSNFTGFKPLGVVLVAMIGIGVVERGGLIATALRITVLAVPRGLVSAALVFAGVMSSLATDVGYVVLVPLGAVIFAGLGRHPLAGLAAAFAGVSAGFSANLLVTPLDSLLAGVSQEAAAILDPDRSVSLYANWYFMFASVFLLTLIGWYVTDRIVEPRLGEWAPSDGDGAAAALAPVSGREKVAAAAALVSFLLVIGTVAAMAIPSGGPLRDADGTTGPLEKSMVTIMLLAFFVPGLTYGLIAGTIRNDRTVARMTAETMNTMGVYIVLAFAAAQFIAYFNWSNLGTMLAIRGAEALRAMDFVGLPLILSFIVVAACLNLFIGSASAKWAIMAPVFVPMFMRLGLSPEMTQASYRVGDSVTNIITPLMPYFPLVIAFGQKYDKKFGVGTLTAAMLPYSVSFLIGWTVLLTIWWFVDLPLGPGAPIRAAVP